MKKDLKIEESGGEMASLMANLPGGIFECLFDRELTIVQMSESFPGIFGYTEEEIETIFHNSFWNMIDPRDRTTTLTEVKKQLATSDTKEIEYRVVCKDGTVKWILDKGQLIHREGQVDSFYCIVIDVTRGKSAQEELRLSLERHEIIMNQTNDIIFEWDMEKDTFTFSTNWHKKFRYVPLSSHIMENILLSAHVHSEDRRGFLNLLKSLKQGKSYGEIELRFLVKENLYIWCRVRMTTQYDQKGNAIKAVGVILDIDQEKCNAQILMEKAQRDTLTKLYNKGTVEKLIEEDLIKRDYSSQAALLMIDVDDFKQINDLMGHLFGDAFLMETAAELKKRFRSEDVLGRIGGDEFIVYVKDIPNLVTVKKQAEKIIEAFHDMVLKDYPKGHVSCSIGISIAPEDGSTFKELYKKADHALYRAKKLGKNQYEIYKYDPNGQPCEMAIESCSAVNEIIDSNKEQGNLSNKLVEYVFQILYQTTDVYLAIQRILEVVGQYFDVSRAYIFENTEDGEFCRNTFEWCNEGVKPEIDNLQHVSYKNDLGGNYLKNFNEDGVFYCQNIHSLSSEEYNILYPQGIKAMLQCVIRDQDGFKGYVGFDECRTNRFWIQEQIDTLAFVSQILSTFLLRQRAQDVAIRTANSLGMILDNQSSWIYVLDPDTYQMLYINHKTKVLVPSSEEGDTCYHAFFLRNTPCERCPLKKLKEGEKNSIMEVYNPVLDVWNLADAAVIEWEGEKAYLVSCHDITNYKLHQGSEK